MLVSEKNHMKVHRNQWVWTRPYHPNALLELHAEDKPWLLRGRSLHSGYALRNSQERGTHNPLCTKHFHGAPSASPHAYLLKSCIGKVSEDVELYFPLHGSEQKATSGKQSGRVRWSCLLST